MLITHDFHIHTRLSLCAGENGGTLQGYLDQAQKFGLKKLGFANHFWDAAVGFDALYVNSNQEDGVPYFYKTQNFEHIYKLKEEIDNTDTGDITVLFGAEGEYDPVNHSVAITEKVAEQLDFLLVPNSHTHMMMDKKLYRPREAHRDFMVKAFEEIVTCPMSKYVDAIAHPFEPVGESYEETTLIIACTDNNTFKRIFTLCAEKEIALEFNSSAMARVFDSTDNPEEHMRMFSIAKECGCKFSFGSDAHHEAGQTRHIEIAQKCVEKFGITEDDIAEFVK